jgi:hypothetical protein
MVTVGPTKSWRLVHDGVSTLACLEVEGYTSAIGIVEASSELGCVAAARLLGIGNLPLVATPTSLTMKQARLALLSAGYLDTVIAGISAMPRASQISWEFSNTVERSDPLTATLAAALGLDSAALDALFTAGALL